jgi:hypothetical protein
MLCPRLRFRQWNRWEESQASGADFDWIIQFRTHHWKLRVQAKCLRNLDNVSRALRHPKDRGDQMRLLLRSSVADGYFPTYAFYSPLVLPCRVQFHHQEAVFLASGFDVFNRFYQRGLRVTATELMGRSFPLAYLLCLALVQASRSPSGPGAWLFEEPLKPKVNIGRSPLQIPDKLGFESGTHYLVLEPRFDDAGTQVERFDDGPIKEYFERYPSVTRVAVLDARGLEDSDDDPIET